MSADDQRTERLDASLRSAIALLAAIAAFIASPVLIGHLCYLDCPAIEIILIAVIPLALGVAVFAARRLSIMLLILIGAPILNFGLTMLYHEWLHTDAFPSVLLGKEARARRIELKESYQISLPELESAEQSDARQPTTAMNPKAEGNEKPKHESDGRSQ